MKLTDVKTPPYNGAFPDAMFVMLETDECVHGWGGVGGAPPGAARP